MGIKFHKPTSPGRRGMSGFVFEEITVSTPEKSLLAPLKKKGGRNNNGRITVRHHGGGHKRRYRIIDFTRNKPEIPAKVPVLNMTLTEVQESVCYIMQMVRNATF